MQGFLSHEVPPQVQGPGVVVPDGERGGQAIHAAHAAVDERFEGLLRSESGRGRRVDDARRAVAAQDDRLVEARCTQVDLRGDLAPRGDGPTMPEAVTHLREFRRRNPSDGPEDSGHYG
jgi:hypothetical protein